jgi:8-oxo-dGTP diphosphatase
MKTVVAAIIVDKGKVLIGRRKEGDSMAHKWEFPGGKPEAGETPEECLKRELFEELGVDAEVGEFYYSGTSSADVKGGIELLAYRASFRTTGPLTLNDHEEVRWVEPRELVAYDFPEADRPIVSKLAEEGVHGI